MITAVDTNVLVDVFGADPDHGPASREALRRCLGEGALIACAVVWAEVTAGFSDGVAASEALRRLRVGFNDIGEAEASIAGEAWRHYRAAGGQRTRVIADFLIGAHAVGRADRLLTRDRGFYRKHFTKLPVIDPSN